MKKNRLKKPLYLLAFVCMLLFMSCTVNAAPKYQNKWLKMKKYGKVLYYDKNGKKATGLTKVGDKYYYFSSKGIQQTGWQCIDGNYYFFQIRNGRGGCMVTRQKINGITLSNSGKATYNSTQLRKLKIMVEANKVMASVTNANMSKSEKLRKCFERAVNYGYGGRGGFKKTISNWDVVYAEDMFYRGHGDCYAFAAAFAYLANAVGYTDVNVISSGGHGWAEVNGKVYDPDWAKVTRQTNTYYAMDYSLSGKGGRPRYKGNRVYVVKI